MAGGQKGHGPRGAFTFSTYTSSPLNNAPAPQHNHARLPDAFDGLVDLGENCQHPPSFEEHLDFDQFIEYPDSPQQPRTTTPALAVEQSSEQHTLNQTQIRQPQPSPLSNATSVGFSTSRPVSRDNEDRIDPALRSKHPMPANHGSLQQILRPRSNLLTPSPGAPDRFRPFHPTSPSDSEGSNNQPLATPSPHHLPCLHNSDDHGRCEDPSTPDPTPRNLSRHLAKNIPKTPTSRFGVQGLQRTPMTNGSRQTRKGSKIRHQPITTNSTPLCFPDSPQYQGREPKRPRVGPGSATLDPPAPDSDSISLSNYQPSPPAPYTSTHTQNSGPHSVATLVDRWILKRPKDFPSTAEIAVIVDLAEGSVTEDEVKDCFREKLFPRAPQDSGYDSRERTANHSTISPEAGTTEPIQLQRHELPFPPIQTSEKNFLCETCKHSFRRFGDLKRHIETHEEPKWRCPIRGCPAVLSRKEKLRAHIKTKHEQDMAEEEIEKFLDSFDPDRDNGNGNGSGGSNDSSTTKPRPYINQGGSGGTGSSQYSSGHSDSYSNSGYTCATIISHCPTDSKQIPDSIDNRGPSKTRCIAPSRSRSIPPTRTKLDSQAAQRLAGVPNNTQTPGPMSLPFRTLKHLGRGAHGSVDKIEYPIGGQVFARKSIQLESNQIICRVRKEVLLMKTMRHPHIVRLEETFWGGCVASLLLPVADCDLKQLMRLPPQDKRLAQSNISLWVWELTSALKYLHSPEVSVIHGDLKPANILVFDSHVRITDFGSASFSNCRSEPPRPGPITKVYAAPEAFNGSEWGQKADVFSLGCVFLEMSTVLMRIPLDRFEDSRTTTAANGKQDSSFHGHLPRVREWISKLRSRSSRYKFVSRVLAWCDQMLQDEPNGRPKASAIAQDMGHSTCSTCSRADTQEEEANCCNKCTTANIPRKFSPSSSSETGRPRYTLEKFQHHRDDTERLLVMQESVRSIHHQSLQSFLEQFDVQFCPSAYHTLQASNAFGR